MKLKLFKNITHYKDQLEQIKILRDIKDLPKQVKISEEIKTLTDPKPLAFQEEDHLEIKPLEDINPKKEMLNLVLGKTLSKNFKESLPENNQVRNKHPSRSLSQNTELYPIKIYNKNS